jgi:hypothetical protein
VWRQGPKIRPKSLFSCLGCCHFFTVGFSIRTYVSWTYHTPLRIRRTNPTVRALRSYFASLYPTDVFTLGLSFGLGYKTLACKFSRTFLPGCGLYVLLDPSTARAPPPQHFLLPLSATMSGITRPNISKQLLPPPISGIPNIRVHSCLARHVS